MLEQIVFQSLCNFFIVGLFAFAILAVALGQSNKRRFGTLIKEHRAKKKEVEDRMNKKRKDVERRTGSIH